MDQTTGGKKVQSMMKDISVARCLASRGSNYKDTVLQLHYMLFLDLLTQSVLSNLQLAREASGHGQCERLWCRPQWILGDVVWGKDLAIGVNRWWTAIPTKRLLVGRGEWAVFLGCGAKNVLLLQGDRSCVHLCSTVCTCQPHPEVWDRKTRQMGARDNTGRI